MSNATSGLVIVLPSRDAVDSETLELAEAAVAGLSDLAPQLVFRDGLWRLTLYRPIRAEWRGVLTAVLRQANDFADKARAYLLNAGGCHVCSR
jgi:hypothetical protein